MEWLALAMYLVGLVGCFGVRTLMHRRRTGGDSGLRRPRRDSGIAWWGAALFVAALLLGLTGLSLGALGLAEPLAPMDRLPVVLWIGVVVAVVGVVGTLWSQRVMGASWRIGVDVAERTDLVTHGAFAWSRNPIFLAMALAQGGLTMVVPNAVQVAATACLVVAVQLQVRGVEEPYLLRSHGAAYGAYASRVGRFAPGVGLLRRPPAGDGGCGSDALRARRVGLDSDA